MATLILLVFSHLDHRLLLHISHAWGVSYAVVVAAPALLFIGSRADNHDRPALTLRQPLGISLFRDDRRALRLGSSRFRK